MKTILVPTDYSSNARKAIRFALDLAKPLQARIILFHTYLVPDPVPAVPRPILPDYGIDRKEQARMKVLVRKVRMISGEELEIDGFVDYGNPIDKIEEVVEGKKIDLIVMGTQGAHYLLDRLTGTTTSAVMKRAPCPVLAIPPGARFQGMSKIVYASDHKDATAVFSSFLLELAITFQAELLVLNIQKEKPSTPNQVADIPEIISRHYPYDNYHFMTEVNDNPEKAIEDFVRNTAPRLLALTVRRRGFFEELFHHSVLQHLAYLPLVPLLALPEEPVSKTRGIGEQNLTKGPEEKGDLALVQ